MNKLRKVYTPFALLRWFSGHLANGNSGPATSSFQAPDPRSNLPTIALKILSFYTKLSCVSYPLECSLPGGN